MLEADDSDSDSGSNDELPYPKLEDSDEESDDGFVDLVCQHGTSLVKVMKGKLLPSVSMYASVRVFSFI